MSSIAIMQPSFMPWLGYLAMMDQVDHFVLLDDVQFDRRSWQQRNRIKGPNGAVMMTVPVQKKGRRDQLIQEVEISYDQGPWAEKFQATLRANYARSAYFKTYAPQLAEIFDAKPKLLMDLNAKLLEFARSSFQISTPVTLSSSLAVSGTKADRLFNICQAMGADHYMSPLGSKGYLDEADIFETEGLPVSYFEYQHPAYDQLFPEFVSHLAFVDALMALGPNAGAVMRSGLV